MKAISLLASLFITSTKSFSLSTQTSHAESNKSQGSLMERSYFLKTMVATTTISSILISSPKRASASTSSKDIIQVGTKAPYFILPNARDGGANVSLDQLSDSGKWTVLYFYPGAFTSGCTLEARGFQRDLEDYRSMNAQIVGVSVDSVEKNAQFCTEEKLDFMLLADVGGKVSKAYGSALSIPGFGTFSNRQTYLIGPTGNVEYVFTDVESRVAKHSSEVLQKLKELQS